jgi:hypothetical protein
MKRITKFKHGPEELEMFAFFDFCRIMESQHPAYGMAFHVPNERKASIQRRVALKRAGVRKGIPDIVVPVPNDKYASLYIEMKVKPNKASPEQMAVLRHLNAVGNYAVLCWSANDAIEIVKKYLANKL